MRIKISDLSSHASTVEVGEQVHDLIAPALASGEPVTLDFEGLRWISAAFFGAAVAALIEADREDKVQELLKIENISPLGNDAYDAVVRCALRRRDPRLAEAMDRAAEKLAARE